MNKYIKVEHVRENNLMDISVEIPYYKHTVIAGVSGSGKSTLAYDVIYATAQRKLLDCMSDQEKRFSKKMKQPQVENIEGLSTVISLKQVKPNNNPRSTIGTYTSIGSFVRNLMAIHSQCQCLYCKNVFEQANLYKLIKDIEALKSDTIVEISFPYFFNKTTARQQQIELLRKKGYRYIYVGNERLNLRDMVEVGDEVVFILVVESRFQASDKLKKSDINCMKSAYINGDNFISIRLSGGDSEGIEAFYGRYGCREHHILAITLEASSFSYNDMSCACPECMGSGNKKDVHPSKVIKYSKKTLRQGPFFKDVYSMSHPYSYMLMYSLACHYGFSFDKPYEELSQEVKDLIMYGSKGETFILKRPEGYDKVLPNYLAKEGELVSFKGILTRVLELYNEMLQQDSEPSPGQEKFFKAYMQEIKCPDCAGTRLKRIKNYILLNGKTYSEYGKMEFQELMDSMRNLSTNEVSQPILESLQERLRLLQEIGLDYLSFDRRIDSLSGGEYQRLRIANQVGSGLVGLTYIIDEPTDGLHGADNEKVISVINKLLDKGNTVITIEHDYDVIKAADYIIEMGPGAGIYGGRIVATGTIDDIKNNSNSIIGRYLSKRPEYILENKSFDHNKFISIKGISENNVKNADVDIPLNEITCFTGVSGSGKSTIVYEVLYKALCSMLYDNRVIPGRYKEINGYEYINNVICIDQQLLNGKNTSIPATYLNIFDTIRDLFAESADDDSEMKCNRAFFSFNSKGACPMCRGKGYIDNYIQYFGETKIICSECNGQQYIGDVLQVKYKDKNIKQVLDMSFSEALSFFTDNAFIYDKVKLVCDLGLGYMKLGQQLSTVSGGEAQRLKLAREMSKYKNKKNLLYIFDEPTIGLHSNDVICILNVMKRIVENGNTVVMVEHNPEMILNSDYIIDMGPGAGRHGGNVMFCGSPYKLLRCKGIKTADYLRAYLGHL